jgi:hypothetical protein
MTSSLRPIPILSTLALVAGCGDSPDTASAPAMQIRLQRIGLAVCSCVGRAALRVVDTHADVNSAADHRPVVAEIAALL